MAINSPIQGGIQAVRNTVSSSLFSGRAIPPPQPDPVTTNLLSQNTASLNSVSQQLSGVSQSLNQLRFSLSVVKSNLDVRSQLERQRTDAEFERERRLATLRLREGKESTIEKKIQNALISPVNKIGSKVQGTLSKLRGAFNILFFGWLSDNALEAYDAIANKNTEAQKKIGFKVLRTIGQIAFTIGAIKLGWKGMTGILSSFAVRMSRMGQTSGIWNPVAGFVKVFKRSLQALGGLSIWDAVVNDPEDQIFNTENYEFGDNKPDTSTDPQENRSIFGRIFGGLFGGDAKASDNEQVKPKTELIPSKANDSKLASQPKTNNKKGNWFTRMFRGKPKEVENPEKNLSEKFKENYTQLIRQESSSEGDLSDSLSNVPLSGRQSGSSENITSVKRSPQVSDQLASLPEEEPIIIPSDGGQSNEGTPNPTGGSVLPGTASQESTPMIGAINPDNTYVYHAYQQFNLTPV